MGAGLGAIRVPVTFGAKVTGTLRAKVTGTQRAKVTGTQGAKVTGTWKRAGRKREPGTFCEGDRHQIKERKLKRW